MEYRDYTSELSELCASCKKDIYGMLTENNVVGITFGNEDDYETILTVYDGDGEYKERAMEYCKFYLKDENVPYERFSLTDVDGHQYSIDDLTENDLMVLYDIIYNHFYGDE